MGINAGAAVAVVTGILVLGRPATGALRLARLRSGPARRSCSSTAIASFGREAPRRSSWPSRARPSRPCLHVDHVGDRARRHRRAQGAARLAGRGAGRAVLARRLAGRGRTSLVGLVAALFLARPLNLPGARRRPRRVARASTCVAPHRHVRRRGGAVRGGDRGVRAHRVPRAHGAAPRAPDHRARLPVDPRLQPRARAAGAAALRHRGAARVVRRASCRWASCSASSGRRSSSPSCACGAGWSCEVASDRTPRPARAGPSPSPAALASRRRMPLFVVSMMLGSYVLGPGEVLRSVLGTVRGAVRRLHRARAAAAARGHRVLAGSRSGSAGTLFQTMLRNPLASPDIIGHLGGREHRAVAGVSCSSASARPRAVGRWPPSAGALADRGAVYLLAWRGGIAGYRFILIGIGRGRDAGPRDRLPRLPRRDLRRPGGDAWLVGSSAGSAGGDETLVLALVLRRRRPGPAALCAPLGVLRARRRRRRGLGRASAADAALQLGVAPSCSSPSRRPRPGRSRSSRSWPDRSPARCSARPAPVAGRGPGRRDPRARRRPRRRSTPAAATRVRASITGVLGRPVPRSSCSSEPATVPRPYR